MRSDIDNFCHISTEIWQRLSSLFPFSRAFSAFPFFRLSLFSAFPSFPRFFKKQKPLPLQRREIISPLNAANFTVLKLISKQACSLKYYRDQIPVYLYIRRYHKAGKTHTFLKIPPKTSPSYSLHFKQSLMRKY